MQEKKAFSQQVLSLGLTFFELRDRFILFEFPFSRRGKLGLLLVFLRDKNSAQH